MVKTIPLSFGFMSFLITTSVLIYTKNSQKMKEYEMHDDFGQVWPHSDIEEVFNDIFLVTGTNKVDFEGKTIQTSRNMLIVREGGKLTLVEQQKSLSRL